MSHTKSISKPDKSQPSNRTHLITCLLVVVAVLGALPMAACLADSPASQPISSRAAFLRAQRASRLQQQLQHQQQPQAAQQNNAPNSTIQTAQASSSTPQPASSSTTTTSTTSTTTTTTTTTTTAKPKLAVREHDTPQVRPPTSAIVAAAVTNRTTRTAAADIDDFNIFVTNTCERELMHVNIKTSRPFHGVIHTRNQRQKAVCTVEGTGETEYNLDISHVLNQQDPNYCGVIKARKESPDDKDLLSVVIAVRVHKNIELSNDKFFLLNCTNRCRRADCSIPASARLSDNNANNLNARVIADELPDGVERENVTPAPASPRPGSTGSDAAKRDQADECDIYKFPKLITLLWCMAILLLASLISHCIMCSSMVCKCVKTEVEEREPSVYEYETDDEDNLYNRKNHPMRIDYDNRDIYKTSNNYEPYNMDDCNEDGQSKSRRASKSKRTARN
jgi:hypothetical protein